MKRKAKPVPIDQATPYLCIKGAARAIEFYKKAFGAKEVIRLTGPEGKIGHAEIRIGDSPIFISDEFPDFDALSPETVGGSSMIVQLYVQDVDSFFRRALRAGATTVFPVNDQFYGDRSGRLKDPFGFMWIVGTHKENVTQTEMDKRFAKMMGGN